MCVGKAVGKVDARRLFDASAAPLLHVVQRPLPRRTPAEAAASPLFSIGTGYCSIHCVCPRGPLELIEPRPRIKNAMLLSALKFLTYAWLGVLMIGTAALGLLYLFELIMRTIRRRFVRRQ